MSGTGYERVREEVQVFQLQPIYLRRKVPDLIVRHVQLPKANELRDLRWDVLQPIFTFDKRSAMNENHTATRNDSRKLNTVNFVSVKSSLGKLVIGFPAKNSCNSSLGEPNDKGALEDVDLEKNLCVARLVGGGAVAVRV